MKGDMPARLRDYWENLASSLWLTPTLLALLAAGLATLTLFLDEHVPGLGGLRFWLFGGTAGAARDLLAAIAGSLITVVALAFSTTLIAIQQASSQFSPRVIRNFMRDSINQVTFGSYVATFIYALLILRQVRDPQSGFGEFVPSLSVTLALVLALICVALLIYFIHHTASSLQVTTISAAIRQDLRNSVKQLYPKEISEPLQANDAPSPGPPRSPPDMTIRSREAGFLRNIDERALLDGLPDGVTFARVPTQVGDFMFEGGVLIELWSRTLLPQGECDGLVAAFTIGNERSLSQDVLFGIRQLVDIALKALSPGINDPTTAENCLAHLGDTVAQLAERPFPAAWRYAPQSQTVVLLNRPDFSQIVDAAFGQIRREAANDIHVTLYLIAVLRQIGGRITMAGRGAAIHAQLDAIDAVLDEQSFAPGDRQRIAIAIVDARNSVAALL
jgi:uncharacterized membrane protein